MGGTTRRERYEHSEGVRIRRHRGEADNSLNLPAFTASEYFNVSPPDDEVGEPGLVESGEQLIFSQEGDGNLSEIGFGEPDEDLLLGGGDRAAGSASEQFVNAWLAAELERGYPD